MATHKVSSSYSPLNDDEVRLNVNDLITVVHEYDDGWAYVKNVTQAIEGLAPFNFLTPYFENNAKESPISTNGIKILVSEHLKPSVSERSEIKEKINMVDINAKERSLRAENMGYLKVMIVGDSGIGKSSLIEYISKMPFIQSALEPSKSDAMGTVVNYSMSTIQEIPSFMKSKVDVEHNLRIFDTTGFGAHVDASKTIDPVILYIKQQFEQTKKLLQPSFAEESKMINLISASAAQSHVDVVVYGIFHRLKPIDKEFMKLLSPYAPIVPIILKSDSLDPSQVFKLKESTLRELEASNIELFSFGLEISECIAMAQMEETGAIPFAINTVDTVSLNRINEMAEFLEKLLFSFSQEIRRSCSVKFVKWREADSKLPVNPFENLSNYKVCNSNPLKSVESPPLFERLAPNYTVTERKGSGSSFATTTIDRESRKPSVDSLSASGTIPSSPKSSKTLPGVTVPPISENLVPRLAMGGGRPQIGARYSSIASGKSVESSANSMLGKPESEKCASSPGLKSVGAFGKLKMFAKKF